MVLSAIIPEQWMFGFIATVMTHNPFFGPALQAAIFLSFTWLKFHRNDPPPLDIHVHITQPSMVWLGSLIGLVFVWFFRSPRFVTTRAYNSRGELQPYFFVLILLVLVLIAGVYELEATSLLLGIPLTIIFGIFVVSMIFKYCVAKPVLPDGLQQIKYLLLFSFVAVIPAANDYPLTIGGIMGPQAIRPWNSFIWFAAYLIAFGVFYLFAIAKFADSKIERHWWSKRKSKDKMRPRKVFVFGLFTAIGLVYGPALLADEISFRIFGAPGTPLEEEQKIWNSVVSVGVSSAVILIVIGGWWWYRVRKNLDLSRYFDAGAGDIRENDKALLDQSKSKRQRRTRNP